MAGKAPKQSVLISTALESIRENVGSGSLLIPAARICGDFNNDSTPDRVTVNAVRLLLCVEDVGDSVATSFYTSSVPGAVQEHTWYTGIEWTHHELQQAYERGGMTSLLTPDPVDTDVFYVTFETRGVSKLPVIDDIDGVVQSFVREISADDYDHDFSQGKGYKSPMSYHMGVCFRRNMVSRLLPSFHRLLMSTSVGASVADVAAGCLDPIVAGSVLDPTSADIFIAYAGGRCCS